MPRGQEDDPMGSDILASVFTRASRAEFSFSFPRKRL